jgi:hypothetical protein
MADEKPKTPNERRKRPAPTIDLSATEVSAEPPPSADNTEKKEGPAASEPPHAEAPRRDNRLAVLALLGGAVAGAAVLLVGLWAGGVLQPGSRSADNLTARVVALETQFKTPAKPTDNPALTDLTARIGKLEQAAAKPAATSSDPAMMERLTAVETAMKALGVTLTALNRRAEETATAVLAARERADAAAKTAEALQAKLDAIEQSAKVTQDKVAQSSGSDTAARRALAAVALRDAVASGVPYSAELAIAKRLGADRA